MYTYNYVYTLCLAYMYMSIYYAIQTNHNLKGGDMEKFILSLLCKYLAWVV